MHQILNATGKSSYPLPDCEYDSAVFARDFELSLLTVIKDKGRWRVFFIASESAMRLRAAQAKTNRKLFSGPT
jgi:hypothetical protein